MVMQSTDKRLMGSSAMAGSIEPQQALATIILWNSGHFDTLDIAQVLGLAEDAICRTLHAARHVSKGGV